MRALCFLFAGCLALPAAFAQAPHALNLVIVEGDGAINNIRQRTAREPIVQVEDENHKPVAGAAVVFLLPEHGAGGTFANGAHSLTVTTNAQGRAAARGIRLNNTQGQFQIQVNATFNGLTATGTISQSIVAGAAAGAGAGGAVAIGLSAKAIAIIAIAAAAVAGGAAYAATRGGSGNSAATTTGTTITPGTGTVGPPTIIIGHR
ncbi:MAG TPA: hypothetical protein VHW09_10210 [Bryobacteraceae bacterium]|jgi:hypothetical protein|nr:hypothetical protein [Bryobacteraceae bacterium]